MDLLAMLKHSDQKEHASASECIWTLSFDKKVRQDIEDYPDLLAAMEEHKDSDSPIVKKNVRGALWVARGENDPTTDPNSKWKFSLDIVVMNCFKKSSMILVITLFL